MKIIDLETWPRKTLFDIFLSHEHPHLGITTSCNARKLRAYAKDHEVPFHFSLVFLVTQAINSIPELRTRIRGDSVVEHDHVAASVTVPDASGTFGFVTGEWNPNGREFVRALQEKAATREPGHISQEDELRDDMAYLSALPWFSFSHITNPVVNSRDSIPRVSWGRVDEEGRFSLSLQAHHGLVDGIHVARFLERLQSALDTPELLWG